MTKKTFLKKLEASLESLGEAKTKRILKKYEKIIDDEVLEGKKEKDVVLSLGSIDVISKLYLQNDTKKSSDKEKGNSTLDSVIDNVINSVENWFDNMDSDLAKRILLILSFIFMGFLTLWVIQIPFKIIDYSGRIIISYIFDNYFFLKAVRSLWSFGLGICFIVIAVYFSVKLIEKTIARYSNNEKINKVTKTKDRENEEPTTSKYNANNNTWDVIFVILKVFIFLLTVPILIVQFGLVMALILMILLIINGVLIYGPAILLLGLIIMVSVILDIIYSFIFKGGIK